MGNFSIYQQNLNGKNTDPKSIISKLNLSKISVSFINKIEIKNGKYEYENNLR